MKAVVLNSQYLAWPDRRDRGYAIACTWAQPDGYRDWLSAEADGLLTYLEDFEIVITWSGIEHDLPTLWETLGRIQIPCRSSVAGPVYDANSDFVLDAPFYYLYGRLVDLRADLRSAGYSTPLIHVIAEATLGRSISSFPEHLSDYWMQQRRFEVLQACRHMLDATRHIYAYGRTKGRVHYYTHKGKPCDNVPVRWTCRDPWGRILKECA